MAVAVNSETGYERQNLPEPTDCLWILQPSHVTRSHKNANRQTVRGSYVAKDGRCNCPQMAYHTDRETGQDFSFPSPAPFPNAHAHEEKLRLACETSTHRCQCRLEQFPHDGIYPSSLPSLLRTPSLNLLPPTLLQLVLLSPTPLKLLKIHIVPTFHSVLFPLPLDL